MNDPNQRIERLIRAKPSKSKPERKTDFMLLSEKHKKRFVLGIELPWDWYLVRGRDLRTLQKQLREAQQTAAMRLRMCANLRRELLRKESR